MRRIYTHHFVKENWNICWGLDSILKDSIIILSIFQAFKATTDKINNANDIA